MAAGTGTKFGTAELKSFAAGGEEMTTLKDNVTAIREGRVALRENTGDKEVAFTGHPTPWQNKFFHTGKVIDAWRFDHEVLQPHLPASLHEVLELGEAAGFTRKRADGKGHYSAEDHLIWAWWKGYITIGGKACPV
jgi:hypothetical protein